MPQDEVHKMGKKWIVNYVNVCNLYVRLEHLVAFCGAEWQHHWTFACKNNMGPNHTLSHRTVLKSLIYFDSTEYVFRLFHCLFGCFCVQAQPNTEDRNQCHKFQCIISTAWLNPIFNPNFVAFQEKWTSFSVCCCCRCLLYWCKFGFHIQFQIMYRKT